jgi:methylenetetrahydrofolate reductase (NADPH)
MSVEKVWEELKIKNAKPSIQEVLDSGKFLVSGEIGPPKGPDVEEVIEHIDLLKDKVHSMNITDNQSSVMRYPSLATALMILERGGEPNLQVTCRDRNRMSLENELLFAYTRGVRSVLCLTGDSVPVGDHKDAKAVFDLESVQLLNMIRTMEEGKDLGGNEMNAPVSFYKGAIVTPEAVPIEPQLIKFEKKVEAGAEWFQTQAIYDMDNFAKFMKIARQYPIKMQAGLVLLTSAGMAKYMNKNVPGVVVPDDLIEEMAGAEKGKAIDVGISIMARHIKRIREENLADGVHIMAIGKEGLVPRILEEAELDINAL